MHRGYRVIQASADIFILYNELWPLVSIEDLSCAIPQTGQKGAILTYAFQITYSIIKWLPPAQNANENTLGQQNRHPLETLLTAQRRRKHFGQGITIDMKLWQS